MRVKESVDSEGVSPVGSSRVASKKRLAAWGGGVATPRKKFPPMQKFTDKNSNNFFNFFNSL